MIVVDASGKVSMMNPTAEALTGWSQADAVGTPASRVFNIVSEGTRRPGANPLEVVLETGTLQGLANHTIDLAVVIHEAVDAVRQSADNKTVTIDVQVMPLPAIRGDAGRLKQVLWNVLGNAIKFTPAGGMVYIRTDVDEERVNVSIRDTGPGIPAALLPYIFEAFRQGDNTQSRTGLGLGLAVARQLVELHGGSIEAQNDGPAGGATFVIRMPAAIADVSAPSLDTPSKLAGI